jgi:hypothetical protein
MQVILLVILVGILAYPAVSELFCRWLLPDLYRRGGS